MALLPLRKIGDTLIQPTHRASCHCGGVVLELDLPDGVVDARRCTCSLCSKKGVIMGAVPLEDLRIVKGRELLTVYRFNTMTTEHYFCSRCGIYTHHQRRSNPQEYGVNVGGLENVNPSELGEIPWSDGVNHPSDRKA